MTGEYLTDGRIEDGMQPRSFLRLEGLAVFAVAVGGYYLLGGPLWLFAVLAFAPDISMAGYLAGPQIGSWIYNIFHTYTLPIALGGLGFVTEVQIALLVALVWAGHIGADRLVGYGLKYESGFNDTHLSTQPAPIPTLTGPEKSD